MPEAGLAGGGGYRCNVHTIRSGGRVGTDVVTVADRLEGPSSAGPLYCPLLVGSIVERVADDARAVIGREV